MRKRTPNPTEDVRLSATVDRTTWERLKQLAIQQNRSLNDLLNEWIREKLAAGEDAGTKGGYRYPVGRPAPAPVFRDGGE